MWLLFELCLIVLISFSVRMISLHSRDLCRLKCTGCPFLNVYGLYYVLICRCCCIVCLERYKCVWCSAGGMWEKNKRPTRASALNLSIKLQVMMVTLSWCILDLDQYRGNAPMIGPRLQCHTELMRIKTVAICSDDDQRTHLRSDYIYVQPYDM